MAPTKKAKRETKETISSGLKAAVFYTVTQLVLEEERKAGVQCSVNCF